MACFAALPVIAMTGGPVVVLLALVVGPLRDIDVVAVGLMLPLDVGVALRGFDDGWGWGLSLAAGKKNGNSQYGCQQNET